MIEPNSKFQMFPSYAPTSQETNSLRPKTQEEQFQAKAIVRNFRNCPRCGSPLIKAKSFNEGESEYWYECSRCNTFINTYIPQEHQAAVHRDDHRFTGNFGGQ